MGATLAQRVRVVMMIALVMSEDWRKHFLQGSLLAEAHLNSADSAAQRSSQSRNSRKNPSIKAFRAWRYPTNSSNEPTFTSKTGQTERIFFTSDCFFCPSCNHSAVYNHYQHQHDQDQTFETFRRPIPDPNMVVVAVVALDLHRRLVHLSNCW